MTASKRDTKKDQPAEDAVEDQPAVDGAEDQPAEDAGRHLVSHVYVDGEVYGPGDGVPAEVAKKITNPNAWSDDSK